MNYDRVDRRLIRIPVPMYRYNRDPGGGRAETDGQ